MMAPTVRESRFDLFLFGKPEWELQEGSVTPEHLRALGQDLKERLEATARAVEVLGREGWEVELVGYSLSFTHPSLTFPDEESAKAYLRQLGLEPERFEVFELEEEEDEV